MFNQVLDLSTIQATISSLAGTSVASIAKGGSNIYNRVEETDLLNTGMRNLLDAAGFTEYTYDETSKAFTFYGCPTKIRLWYAYTSSSTSYSDRIYCEYDNCQQMTGYYSQVGFLCNNANTLTVSAKLRLLIFGNMLVFQILTYSSSSYTTILAVTKATRRYDSVVVPIFRCPAYPIYITTSSGADYGKRKFTTADWYQWCSLEDPYCVDGYNGSPVYVEQETFNGISVPAYYTDGSNFLFVTANDAYMRYDLNLSGIYKFIPGSGLVTGKIMQSGTIYAWSPSSYYVFIEHS